MADSVSPRTNRITSHDQFKPIRNGGESLGVNYNCQYCSRTDTIIPSSIFFLFFISEKPVFGLPLLFLEHFYASLHFRTHDLFHFHLERGKSMGCSRAALYTLFFYIRTSNFGAEPGRFIFCCDLRLKTFLRCS